MSADTDSPAREAEAPLPDRDRLAALDVLRGFALLGIFIMNMPGFSHSMFAPPAPATLLDAAVAAVCSVDRDDPEPDRCRIDVSP